MASLEDIAASYSAEKNYSHNLDDVIDSSGVVGAWGCAKESTTELADLSGNKNVAEIHGPMPAEGFIQGRRFTAANGNYLDCGSSIDLKDNNIMMICVIYPITTTQFTTLIGTVYDFNRLTYNNNRFAYVTYDTVQRYLINPTVVNTNVINIICGTYDGVTKKLYVNSNAPITSINSKPTAWGNTYIGGKGGGVYYSSQIIMFSLITSSIFTETQYVEFYNTLARLPFWTVNYTDYPNNVTEYTDNLPYSSSIINSGTFKVDDDKLQCVSAGTMTYSASYEFDGSEYIKVEIDGVEYAGTGTITHGNTTVSVAQGSNKVTVQMGTGDTIECGIDIQFRAEV